MRIGVTGHRAADLGGYSLPNLLYNKVCQEVQKHFLELSPELVLTGVALGFDQYVANICNKLKIPYMAVIPFLGQEKMWIASAQKAYHRLLKNAREQIIVSPGLYSADKMYKRNEFIVDNSDIMLACLRSSKTSGGTFQCVQYAKKQNKQVIVIDPDMF